MRKIITLLFIIMLTISSTFATEYVLTSSDKITVNKVSSKIQDLLDKQTLSFRSNLEIKINELQEKYKNSIKIYNIFEQIKKNTHLFNYKTEYTKHYNNNHVDFEKVKDVWLNWHNEARNKLGRNLYTYDGRLNSTAYEWSKIQQAKLKMTHERNTGDGFYNYSIIEKWFNTRGIKCKVLGGATSSESIGKFGYYCKDLDCTDELITSLKQIFDIYMAEKGLGYPADAHYKGITLAELSKIGLGISIAEDLSDGYGEYKSYNYYLTTHYCTEFKN